MRDIRRRDGDRDRRATANASAQIMSGQTELTDVSRQPPPLFQRVLDRMRCGKSLRTEQQKSQQEREEAGFHGGKFTINQPEPAGP